MPAFPVNIQDHGGTHDNKHDRREQQERDNCMENPKEHGSYDEPYCNDTAPDKNQANCCNIPFDIMIHPAAETLFLSP